MAAMLVFFFDRNFPDANFIHKFCVIYVDLKLNEMLAINIYWTQGKYASGNLTSTRGLSLFLHY